MGNKTFVLKYLKRFVYLYIHRARLYNKISYGCKKFIYVTGLCLGNNSFVYVG